MEIKRTMSLRIQKSFHLTREGGLGGGRGGAYGGEDFHVLFFFRKFESALLLYKILSSLGLLPICGSSCYGNCLWQWFHRWVQEKIILHTLHCPTFYMKFILFTSFVLDIVGPPKYPNIC